MAGLLDAEEGRLAAERSGDPRFAPAPGGDVQAAPAASPSFLQRAWGMLPPEVRKAYASSPEAMAWLYRNVSTPGAIQDTVEAVQDTAKSAVAGEGWGTATNLAKTLGAAIGAVPGGKLAVEGTKKLATKVFPELAERYPKVARPVMEIDKTTGKEFPAKQLSKEALDFQKQRALVQKDIDAGNYTPYFDPEKRFDVDPTKYEPRADTLAIRKVKPETQAKYDAIVQDPDTLKRLDEAYQRGMRQAKEGGNWYQMGQLEKAFTDEYGEKVGRVLFKERFADAMAATTGGADPTSNLLMAHYGNFVKNQGGKMPDAAYKFPFPIGGRYVTGNMEQYDKMLMQGTGLTPANPKRYSFSGNFLGNKGGATVDEQMMGLLQPGTMSPPAGTYGHYERGVVDAAERAGVDPRYYQEVAWAGAKDAKTKGGYAASPMISNVNQAIERTSRLTGLSPQDVVRRGLVRAEIPLYGAAVAAPAAAIGGASLLSGPDERQAY